MHCCYLSFITPYVPWIHTVMMTLGIHGCNILFIIPYVSWIHTEMMTRVFITVTHLYTIYIHIP